MNGCSPPKQLGSLRGRTENLPREQRAHGSLDEEHDGQVYRHPAERQREHHRVGQGVEAGADRARRLGTDLAGLRQERIEWRGSAIECRIYAEDPYRDFLPYPGKLTRLTRPLGPGVRIDGCVYDGWTVPMEYDPLLAKLAAVEGGPS